MTFWGCFDQWGVTAEDLLSSWDRQWDRSPLPSFLKRALPEKRRLDFHWQRCLAQLLVWLSFKETLGCTNEYAAIKLQPVRLPLETIELRVCGEDAPAFVDLLRQPCGDEGLPYVMVNRSKSAQFHTFTSQPAAARRWFSAISGQYWLVSREDHEPIVCYQGQTGSLVLIRGTVNEGFCQPSGLIVYPFPHYWQAAAEYIDRMP